MPFQAAIPYFGAISLRILALFHSVFWHHFIPYFGRIAKQYHGDFLMPSWGTEHDNIISSILSCYLPQFLSIHAMRRLTIFCRWDSVNSQDSGTLYHLFRHPRQQQAVACIALKTGWPCIGVCLPSFAGFAGASLWRTKSSACFRMTSMPFSSRYACSFLVRWKLERNLECFNFSNAWSIV